MHLEQLDLSLTKVLKAQDETSRQGAGEDGHLTPGSSAIPPEGLASAGTSGLHRRWSLGGNFPQPGPAKTCNPNVDPWLWLPSPG